MSEYLSFNDTVSVISSIINKKLNNQIIIKEQVKKLKPDAYTPKLINNNCKELYALYTVKDGVETDKMIIHPYGNLLIKTGIAITWDNSNYNIQILPNPNLKFKNIISQECIIEHNYKQEIGILLHNNTGRSFDFRKGDCIAQYNYIRVIIQIKIEEEVVEEFNLP